MEKVEVQSPVDSLSRAYLINFPGEAARILAGQPPNEAAEALQDQPIYVLIPLFQRFSHGVLESILGCLPTQKSAQLLNNLDPSLCAALLSRLDEQVRQHYLSLLKKNVADELKDLLEYPEDSAGRLMQSKVIAFPETLTVEQALAQAKQQKIQLTRRLYLLDDSMRLSGQIDTHELVQADQQQPLASLSIPIAVTVDVLAPKSEVTDKLNKFRINNLPVVDIDFRLVGSIEGQTLIDAIREDFATDMQTMVGVSKDERALSSSWFAVRKRQPWLQINLLTAFLAAGVVGLFESTIAKYTALAILLPIAAGQSGNTGAQALAVTMRGLTLREITIRHWFRVTLKESGAGLVNGLAIAVTCGLGVFVWSRSYGLSLIIALAMISSMTIAAVSGALVPIILKRLGQDPALSSSIILTTVTDIAGFMSFLGIATLLSGMLEAV